MLEKAERKSLEPYLRDDVEFYVHQTVAVRKMAKLNGHLLADDMGLGKSLQALTVFCIALKMRTAETCIIVCPVTLRDNWADEIEKFTRIPYTRLGEEINPHRRGEYRKLSPVNREEQLVNWLNASGPRILICNYEQLCSTHHAGTLKHAVFDFGLYDEAHFIKNHKSNRTKAALALNTKRSFLLTGTPMLNQVDELWPLLHKIDPAGFPRYWGYVNRYCVFGGYGDKQIVGTKNTNELKSHLARHMTRRLKINTLSLTAPQEVTAYVGLSDIQRKMYDTAAEELLLEYPGGALPPSEIANAMTKFLRLLQICDTPFCIDPNLPDSSLKLDRTVEIIAEKIQAGERVPVFAIFRGVLTALRVRLEKAKIGPIFELHGDVKQSDRVPTVKAWSESYSPGVILCMSQVAGTGLNMVAASTVVRVGRQFVPGLNQQVVDRVQRIGQTKPVQVFDLVTRGTVESRVLSIVRAKLKLNEDIVEGSTGMRSLLEKLKEQLKDDMS